MKKIFLLIMFSLWIALFNGYVDAGYVRWYFRTNWTYVKSYYRTAPNAYKYDNYSYRPTQWLYNKSYRWYK